LFLRGHFFRANFEFKGKHSHCSISICQKLILLRFCKVVWRRYFGEVGKFYRTLWLIYTRHCMSISVKSVKYCTSYDKKFRCVFM